MAYDKNVFILGAGASVDAGAPVLNWIFLRGQENCWKSCGITKTIKDESCILH